MTMKTNEKNPIIAERVGIDIVLNIPSKVRCCGKVHYYPWQACRNKGKLEYKKKKYCWMHLPKDAPIDFFTPEGQVVLAGVLLGKGVGRSFLAWLIAVKGYGKGTFSPHVAWLEIIAETKLAEIFWEFIQSETEGEKDGDED